MHEGILKGAPVAEEDRAVMSDPLHFGVIHGDVNISNFFFIESEQSLHVFDWDQTQRGWYLWDLA
jgi:Ser/Thr protein kinase RdoA (MazF antagonist)